MSVIRCAYDGGMTSAHINHQMHAVSLAPTAKSYYLHITKSVTQETIDTTVIDSKNFAQTLCNKTFTWGSAWEMAATQNDAAKVCKACATKFNNQ